MIQRSGLHRYYVGEGLSTKLYYEDAEYWLKLATFLQIVEVRRFASFMGIEIKLVMKNSYDSWPKTKQTPKRSLFGYHRCAHTGRQDWFRRFRQVGMFNCHLRY